MKPTDLIELLIRLEGRISRAPYWIGWLIILAGEIALRLVFGIPFIPAPADAFAVRGSSFLIDVVLLYPSIVVMVKRLHDRDHSGWVIGWLIVPSVVLMLTNLLGMSGDPEHAGVVESLLVIATGVIWLAFMIELGFRPGTPGENQYGPDPLGRA